MGVGRGRVEIDAEVDSLGDDLIDFVKILDNMVRVVE